MMERGSCCAMQRARCISPDRLRAVSLLPSDSWSPHFVARLCSKSVVPVTAFCRRRGKLALLGRAIVARGSARSRGIRRRCSSTLAACALPAARRWTPATAAPAERAPLRGRRRGSAGSGAAQRGAVRAERGAAPPMGRRSCLELVFDAPDPKAETGRRFVVPRAPVVSSPPTIVRGCSLPPPLQWPGSKQC